MSAVMPCTGPRRSRGAGLIDALVALAILSFGLLALTHFQGRLVAQTTEAQMRTTAQLFADELFNTALVDPANLACYTVPAAGTCGNAAARSNTDAWGARVLAAMPGNGSVTATRAGTRLSVVISWTGKESGEARQLTAVTDVQ
jgi:type IV pilus assembly protein PilV